MEKLSWLVIGLLALPGCYLGAGPAVGVSAKHKRRVIGWEASAVAVGGLSGGQAFRRDPDGWKTASWGAFGVELPLIRNRDALAAPLLRAQIGGAEGDECGFVAGFGAGAIGHWNGICGDTEYVFDTTLTIRRIAGDTQLLLVPRIGFLGTPACKEEQP